MESVASNTKDVDLIELTSNTIHELEEIWNEIGLTKDSQQVECNQLVADVIQTYQRKIDNVKALRDSKVASILSLQTEIKIVAEQVDEPIPENLYNENETLMEKVEGLNAILTGLKTIKEERITQFSSLKSKIFELSSSIGEDIEDEYMDILSDLKPSRETKFQNKIRELQIEKENRRKAVDQIVNDCTAMLIELQLEECQDIDEKILRKEGLSLSMDSIEALSKRASELTEEKTQRENTLKELGVQINDLWERLKISKNTQEAFFEGVSGIGMNAIRACEEELNRLIRLKQERLGDLIKEIREDILELWNEMEFSSEVREKCTLMNIPLSEFNEDVLNQHEIEVKSLKKRLETMKPLLKYIEKRDAILKDRDEYEESLKDPERLLGRGKRDTGRLLREEKLQSRIKKDLPKITEFLKQKIPAWEKEYDMLFLYKGENYLEKMETVDRLYMEKREREKLEKERKKKEQLKHEHAWGSTPSKPLRSRKSISTSARKQRPSISSRSDGGLLSPNNVCAISREVDEREETDRRLSTSTQSSSRSDEIA